MRDEVEPELFSDFWVELNQILLVVFGEDDLFETGAVGGQSFFFQAANFGDTAAKGDLTSHADEAAGGAFGEGGK